MPRGARHVETGILRPGRWGYSLEMDGGGIWQLDVSGSARRYLGQRVTIEGTRSDFDLIDVQPPCLIARRFAFHPVAGRESVQHPARRIVGTKLEMPESADWNSNLGVSDIETILTSSVGIAENVTTVPEGQTRNPISANIRHALMFCIQDEDEIDSRKMLFHRQSEPYLPQTIKDVLPYFLGAMGEDLLQRKVQLDLERIEFRKLQKLAGEREQLANLSAARTEEMFREAQSVGLIPPGQPPAQQIALSGLRAINPAIQEVPVPPDSTEPIVILRRERTSLRRDLGVLKERLRQIRYVEYVAGGFAHEVEEQRARLATLGLVAKGDVETCALCGSTDVHVPPAAEMHKTLSGIDEQLSQIRREVPRLQEV